MTFIRASLLIIIALMAISKSASAEERIALLIGNKNYNQKVGPLINPHNDVEILKHALMQLGFQVTVAKDASYGEMSKLINAHVQRIRTAGQSAVSFFYYAGHGASDASQYNFLLPVDIPDAEENKVAEHSIQLQADLLDKLETQAAEAIHFVVLDACRTELQMRHGGARPFTSDKKAFVPMVTRGKALVAYSTEPRRTASDQGIGSGHYARILSEEMVVPNVESVSMFRQVHLRVDRQISQHPYMILPSTRAFYFAGTSQPGPIVRQSTSETFQPAVFNTKIDEAVKAERVSSKEQMKVLFAQLGGTVSPGGVVATSRTWPVGSTVKACFLDGSLEQRIRVATVAKQWTLWGDIDFDFGGEKLHDCVRDSAFDIRISFEQNGDWAFLGTDARAQQGATVNINSVKSVSTEGLRAGRADQAILHEFGHVLGFQHSFTVPQCRDEMNWDVVYKKAQEWGLTRNAVDLNFKTLPSDATVFNSFDKNSVMTYSFPPEFFVKGRQSECFAEPINQISLRDKLAVYITYRRSP